MEFVIPEESARHLELYHYEFIAMKLLVETVYTSDIEIAQEKLEDLLIRYKMAAYHYNVAYSYLVSKHVPTELMNLVEFNFQKCAFILKTTSCLTCK